MDPILKWIILIIILMLINIVLMIISYKQEFKNYKCKMGCEDEKKTKK